MRIGVYLGFQPQEVGGGYTYLENIVEELNSYKGRYEFYFFHYGESLTFGDEHGRFISLDNPAVTEGEIPALSLQILKHKIDLFLFLTTHFEFVHVPYICTVWDLEHRKQPFFPEVSQSGWTWGAREANYRDFLHRAAYVITGTEKGKEEIHDFYRVLNERIKVIPFPTPNWVLEYENKQFDTPLSDVSIPFLFYPAQFWPHKNHIVLLHALKILINEYSYDFQLVFTGSDMGNLQHVKEEATRLGLEKRVLFKGFVDRDELVFLYKNAFALVYPSFFGPDNLPPLEAFFLGCPVLAASTLGSNDHIKEAAILFDPGNEKEIAEKIHILSLDETLRRTLIEKGHAFIKKRKVKDCVHEIIALLDAFEIYRRTWGGKTLYHHLQPGSDVPEKNVQYTIDEIYSKIMSYQKTKKQLDNLLHQLKKSEADRAASLERINRLEDQLKKSEADRAASLERINRLEDQLKKSEADRAARLERINRLEDQLKKSEADRAARLERINRLEDQLKKTEADRAARLERINRLEDQLKKTEADRAARLELIIVEEKFKAKCMEVVTKDQDLMRLSEKRSAERQRLMEEINQNKEHIKQMEADIQKLDDSLREKDKLLKQKEKENITLLNSKSWKITAPLRTIHSILKKEG